MIARSIERCCQPALRNRASSVIVEAPHAWCLRVAERVDADPEEPKKTHTRTATVVAAAAPIGDPSPQVRRRGDDHECDGTSVHQVSARGGGGGRYRRSVLLPSLSARCGCPRWGAGSVADTIAACRSARRARIAAGRPVWCCAPRSRPRSGARLVRRIARPRLGGHRLARGRVRASRWRPGCAASSIALIGFGVDSPSRPRPASWSSGSSPARRPAPHAPSAAHSS